MYKIHPILKRVNLLFLIKAGVGSAIAIWLASSFGLLYSPSAGIITLLTIQNTKKQTLEIALRRIMAFLLAVAISFIVFRSLGYHSASFGVFILVFVGLCIALRLEDGISMNAVLMTHFLIEEHMDFDLIVNEVCILLLGMGIGILLNLFMPKYKKRIRREQLAVEEAMKEILRSLAMMLRNKEMLKNPIQAEFTRLDVMLEELLKKAYEDAGNTLLNNTRYLVSYLEMRKHQVDVLKSIQENIQQIPVLLPQSLPLADFMVNTAESYHELNNVEELLQELQALNQHYKKEALPVTREEFEYRAILFQILKQLEYFLIIKRSFVKELDETQMNTYWS